MKYEVGSRNHCKALNFLPLTSYLLPLTSYFLLRSFMDIIILILALILLSYIMSERAFRIHRPTLAIHLTYGAEFAVVGLLLGPYVLDILTPDLVDKL